MDEKETASSMDLEEYDVDGSSSWLEYDRKNREV